MAVPSRRAFLIPVAGLLIAGTIRTSEVRAGEPAAPPKPFTFMPLGDFTVNLPLKGRRHQYFLVSVTLETKTEDTQAFVDIVPRLKDSVLQRLMQMSSRDELRPGETDIARLRENLFASLREVRTEGLKSVVITRMMHT
jgi:hypothetical protein